MVSVGRKDPFPRPLDIVRSSATTVDNKELTANATTSAEVGTVSYTISNPDIRIFLRMTGIMNGGITDYGEILMVSPRM